MSGLTRCWTSSASSVSQLLRSMLQLLEILGLGDLGHLARLLGLVDLDPQLPHLLLQALYASVDLARHPWKTRASCPSSSLRSATSTSLSGSKAPLSTARAAAVRSATGLDTRREPITEAITPAARTYSATRPASLSASCS